MKDTIALVTHRETGRDDRAATVLSDLGYRLQWCCPAVGDALPAPDESLAGAVLYGGPQPLDALERYPFLKLEMDWIGEMLALDRPVLGLCLGGQLLAHHLGAAVGPHPRGIHEYGYYPLLPTAAGEAVFGASLRVFQSHYHGFDLPAGAELLARGEDYPHQAFRYGAKAFGFQFHPEVTSAMVARWVAEDAEMHGKPGAHSAERQLADDRRYNAPMGTWFTRFLKEWIAA